MIIQLMTFLDLNNYLQYTGDDNISTGEICTPLYIIVLTTTGKTHEAKIATKSQRLFFFQTSCTLY